MARYISSESDDYYQPPPRQRHHAQTNDDRVYRLTSNLQDTTRNLRSLDRMLDDYSAVGSEQKSSIDRIRGELDRTHEDIRDERARGHAIDRDYGSDSENYGSSPRGRRRKRSAVRFADDMNKELHGIHQTVRDISSEQIKLEESFNKEMDRRDRHETETRRSLRQIGENLKSSSDPLSDRVERRLQAIQTEIKSEKHHLDRDRMDELYSLSSDLRNAIQSSSSQANVDDKLRSQYLQSESLRHKVESDLDTVRRRLDQTEGSRIALQNQVEQLRAQLSRAEQDRHRIRIDLDESRVESEVKEQRRKRAAEEDRAHSMERELHEMKNHLARSVGAVSELEELRRRLEKSERQRAQLSDHIETLAKDLDNRDRQSAKVITQLKEISDKFEDSDRQRKLLSVQLDDVQQKLQGVTRELEKTTHELRNTQLALQDSEKKKDDFKCRAQETVRQWKAKVKSLERDLDRQKHGTGQMMARNEQLVKEMEGQKQHGNYSQMQIETLKRELADALAVRAAQDEQIRLKDIEVNELKSVRMDLDKDYRDTRTIAEKMEAEIHSLRSRLASVSEDKHRVENKLSAIEAAHLLAQNQSRSLQDELKELSTVKAGVATQLAETSAKNHDLNQAVVELQHKERAAREEVDLYKKQLCQERNGLSKDYETLKRELNEAKVREAHTMQEVNRKFRAHSAENDATIQALKLELSEEKSNSKILGRNADRLKEEMDILEKRFRMSEEENTSMRRKIELVRHEFETQSQLAEDDLNRVKKLENQLGSAQMELEKLEKQQINLIQEIAIEIDALVETASIDATSRCQPINGLKNLAVVGSGIPTHLLTEIKNKIKWLRSEFRERLARERRLRQEFRTALSSTDADRHFLVTELARKDDELDDLVQEKQEIAFKEVFAKNAVEDLEEQVLDLSGELHVRRIREEEQRKMFAIEKQNIIEEMEDIMDAQKEKEKIEERYKRLQGTLKSLQHDLKSNGENGKKTNGILRKPTSPAPRRRNHVRISSSTPTKEFNSSDPVTPSQTPPPMALSDDEFRSKFMPRTPQSVET
ncbi:centrosomal protein of 128 kDa isoform X2 [Aplysia californica]|uniref:Centrosomal protein of 128 kDa isoform X2 n=1 Tax=Aplysia californica TaxID=6500 RepID=A0ABM0K166_APLCA|nr:centrosomal protein of 128 kDa isoform X2 [Aplysia californica]